MDSNSIATAKRGRFRVLAISTDYLEADIWAEDESQADTIGNDLDGCVFSSVDSDWTVMAVEAVEDGKPFAPVND